MAVFAYGGYKRTLQAEAAARRYRRAEERRTCDGCQRGVYEGHPARYRAARAETGAGTYSARAKQTSVRTCGADPRTGQPFRFDPQSGRPCDNAVQLERVVVRRAAPNPPAGSAAADSKRADTGGEPSHRGLPAGTGRHYRLRHPSDLDRRTADSFRRRPADSSGDLDQVAALAQALTGPRRSDSRVPASIGQALLSSQQTGDDYELQNMQTRKQAFLESARGRASDYLLLYTNRAAEPI